MIRWFLVPALAALSGCGTAPGSVNPAGSPEPGLIVIAPAALGPALDDYLAFRAKQIPARLVTLEEVIRTTPGTDEAESVKRFLYQEWRDRGVRYALLVGDADVFPVRYMMLDRVAKGAFDTAFYPSDLYYGDVAEADGRFEDWNAAREGIHAQYFGEVHGEHYKDPPMNFDAIDYVPEIAVGRWPVSTLEEARIVAAKTMEFEKGRAARRRVGLVVTDGWVDARGVFDGIAAGLPAGWEARKLYYGREPAPTPETVAALLDEGALFVAHAGHGEAHGWDRCLHVNALRQLRNADRLPVLMSAGCGTAVFAAQAPYEAYLDVLGAEHPGTNAGEVFSTFPPPPACFQPGRFNSTSLGERLLRDGPGGAVAYFGCNTGSQPCSLTLVEGFLGGLASTENRRLGDLWRAALVHYVREQKLASIIPTEDWYPASIFFQGMKFMLFGDPSIPVNP
ncbi:MAG: hypothetical protein HYY18_17535 [Planctomycetes bacterium]|nr:hypothetical protein [Planctomycetota bacterium]